MKLNKLSVITATEGEAEGLPMRTSKFSSSISDSIVIGFWVGLAVFVIFMFFVLMLLTKTRAPHQE